MRSLKNKPQTQAPSAKYPEGRILDDDGTGVVGTPVNEDVYGDWHQFFSRLMVEAGITPNEIDDNAYDGFQLLQALLGNSLGQGILKGLRPYTFSLGNWNMNSTGAGTQSVNIAHGLGANYKNVRGCDIVIYNDANNVAYPSPVIHADTNAQVGIASVDNTNIVVQHSGGSSFFNSGSFVTPPGGIRGYVTIWVYQPVL